MPHTSDSLSYKLQKEKFRGVCLDPNHKVFIVCIGRYKNADRKQCLTCGTIWNVEDENAVRKNPHLLKTYKYNDLWKYKDDPE